MQCGGLSVGRNQAACAALQLCSFAAIQRFSGSRKSAAATVKPCSSASGLRQMLTRSASRQSGVEVGIHIGLLDLGSDVGNVLAVKQESQPLDDRL